MALTRLSSALVRDAKDGGTLGECLHGFMSFSQAKEITGSDQAAMEYLFSNAKVAYINESLTLTEKITTDRSSEVTVLTKPGVVIKNLGYMPTTRTNPNHVVSGLSVRNKFKQDNQSINGRVYSKQAASFEAAVHDAVSNGGTSSSENFVALYSGIEFFNSTLQRGWAFNSVTNCHGMNTGDEMYGYELDFNVDGNLNGGGQAVGLYIAGIGDLRKCANSDGIRVQRLRDPDGLYKWNYGLRVFDSMTGIAVIDSATYSIFAQGPAPIVRRKTVQDGGWSYIHSLSTANIPWGVDDYGYTYSSRLYLGSGSGKSKYRVNLEGGVSFYTTNKPVGWGDIAAGASVTKDFKELFGLEEGDYSKAVFTIGEFRVSNSYGSLFVTVYTNSEKTQGYVKVTNLGSTTVTGVGIGINLSIQKAG